MYRQRMCSNALSTEAPNVLNVTAQPSVLTTGETTRLDFYYSETARDEQLGRQLDPSELEAWVFQFWLAIRVGIQFLSGYSGQ